MALTIPDELVRATHLTESELKLEIALMLYSSERLTLGQAGELSELSQEELLVVLGTRGIPVHYGVAELEEDVETLRELGPRAPSSSVTHRRSSVSN